MQERTCGECPDGCGNIRGLWSRVWIYIRKVRVSDILSLTVVHQPLEPLAALAAIFEPNFHRTRRLYSVVAGRRRFYVSFRNAVSIFPLSAQGVLCGRLPGSYPSASSWQCARPVRLSLPGVASRFSSNPAGILLSCDVLRCCRRSPCR